MRINISGSKKAKDRAELVLAKEIEKVNVGTTTEPQARLAIQKLMDDHDLTAMVIINGNSVWSKKRVMAALSRIIAEDDMEEMDDYLYHFLSLCCGSIAHYNKRGWIDAYPSVDALKKFFQRNEFGRGVVEHTLPWRTDCMEIAKSIVELFNLKSKEA